MPLGSGTGFVFKYGNSYSLATNWHVLSGRHPSTKLSFDTISGYIPNRIMFYVGVRYPQEKIIEGRATQKLYLKPMELNLYNEEGVPIWYESNSNEVFEDVAIIPLSGLVPEIEAMDAELVAVHGGHVAMMRDTNNEDCVVNLVPEVSEDVFILGYPQGQTFQNAFPVWKRGTIASEPCFGVVSEDKASDGLLFVDASTNQGMSGAPVLYFGSRLRTIFGEKIDGSKFPEPLLVGVYAGREGVTMDLSRFDAAPLIAFTATKETDYGTETDGRIPP